MSSFPHRSIARFAIVCLTVAVTSSILGGLASAGAKPKASARQYHPHIDPADFQDTVDNPWFPLVPGTRFQYAVREGNIRSENEVTVTSDPKTILGVKCTVVHDVVRTNGVISEDTWDWYAQDKEGRVWYFGEDTKEIHANGKSSTEGSWEAGVDGAEPGIIMFAGPTPGAAYRQEYLANKAEDMGQVVAVDDSVSVPYGHFTGCVRTREWSMLEAGSEKKWYAKGVGFVRSQSTTHETAELVSMSKP